MLYDGALRFIADAERAIATGDVPARATAIRKALAIVGELRSTLDMERGGAVADELDRLYDYIQDRLIAVTRDQHPQGLTEARAVLTSLADAWRTIAAGGAVSAPALPAAAAL
jgi:flagellar protein FliS